MPSDRDLAQQWLAERLHDIECGCKDGFGEWESHLAAAILDTPGVEVGRVFHPLDPHPTRLVIWLPIDEKEERDVQR